MTDLPDTTDVELTIARVRRDKISGEFELGDIDFLVNSLELFLREHAELLDKIKYLEEKASEHISRLEEEYNSGYEAGYDACQDSIAVDD